ncbi:unnamed protein product [Dicrocoelium dendriticum]|nr:unnamed protein product [Dicrocoelium dendriticum]
MSLSVTSPAPLDPEDSLTSTNLSVFIPTEQYMRSDNTDTIRITIRLPIRTLADLCKRTVKSIFTPDYIRQLDLPQLVINNLVQPMVVPWDRLATNRS